MYITVEELNGLIPSIFLSTELVAIGWDKVSQGDKEVLIARSGAFLTSLDYDTNKIDDAFIDSIKKAQVCVIYDILASIQSSRYELRKQGVKSINSGGVSESYTDEKVEEVSNRYKQYIEKYKFTGVIGRFL